MAQAPGKQRQPHQVDILRAQRLPPWSWVRPSCPPGGANPLLCGVSTVSLWCPHLLAAGEWELGPWTLREVVRGWDWPRGSGPGFDSPVRSDLGGASGPQLESGVHCVNTTAYWGPRGGTGTPRKEDQGQDWAGPGSCVVALALPGFPWPFSCCHMASATRPSLRGLSGGLHAPLAPAPWAAA